MKSVSAVRRQKEKALEGSKPLEPLLSIIEAAQLLNVSPNTLRQWLSQRRVAYVKVGRRTMLKPGDIERFIESNRKEAQFFDGR